MSETAVQNGRQRGRYAAPLPETTLSGAPVRLHRAGPTTIRAIRAAVWEEWRGSNDPDKQEPQPPVVTSGDITEANYADPDYAKAHREWQGRREQAAAERIVDYIALYVVEPVEGIDYEALQHYRETMATLGVAPRWESDGRLTPEQRDHLVYVAALLIDEAAPGELQILNRWVYGGQAPTESEVRDALITFRPDVERGTAGSGDPAPASERAGDGAAE